MSTKITDIYLRYLNGEANRIELDVLFLYFEKASKEELQALADLSFEQSIESTEELNIDEHLKTVHDRLIVYTSRKHRFIRWKAIRYAAAASLLIISGLSYFLTKKI